MKQIINNLIDNLINIPCKRRIDLILDGGAFNGSYMIGSLLYLKELEKQKFICIERISGCSIGSLLGCLYIGNYLSIHEIFYKFIRYSLGQGNLKSYATVLNTIRKQLPKDFYKKCTNVLYVSFYDILNGKQIVIHEYESNEHLFECIYCSSFLPFIMNGNLCYQGKYVDGFHPYMFPDSPLKSTLFIDLIQQNITKMLIIKNEVNNSERIMKGILETHSYFFSNSPFSFVSNIYDINFINMVKLFFHKLRLYITQILVFVLQLYKKHKPNISCSNNIEGIIKYLSKSLLTYNIT